MGNCMHGNSVANPAEPKKTGNAPRSKRNSAEIPTYPSIEDVINNNRRKRLRENKENVDVSIDGQWNLAVIVVLTIFSGKYGRSCFKEARQFFLLEFHGRWKLTSLLNEAWKRKKKNRWKFDIALIVNINSKWRLISDGTNWSPSTKMDSTMNQKWSVRTYSYRNFSIRGVLGTADARRPEVSVPRQRRIEMQTAAVLVGLRKLRRRHLFQEQEDQSHHGGESSWWDIYSKSSPDQTVISWDQYFLDQWGECAQWEQRHVQEQAQSLGFAQKWQADHK